MKNHLTIFLTLMICYCSKHTVAQDLTNKSPVYKHNMAEDYEVSFPEDGGQATLVLFGGFPQRATDIKEEFDFLELAKMHQLSVVYMNYNRKLWLTDAEKQSLSERLVAIFNTLNLSTDKVHIGGFSSGGNIALLLSNYLVANELSVQPQGVFVVDSPVDLLELYRLCERNITRQFSQASMQEAAFLVRFFDHFFGPPEKDKEPYEEHSPYTSETKNIENLSSLDGVKIRFYSEPDAQWWKDNRQNEPTDMNAHWIEKLSTQLAEELPNTRVEYITTEDKGYRANGDRHPHSWSIVDQEELVRWMLGN
ncbi:MAG: hypothetical protein R8G66_11275 [Cytophagales bacterium]|nr:hypothetical protein [Cytophagales bacterium]